MTEVELAAKVTAWLTSQHWEVFPEVQPGVSWPRADIVARQSGRIWVIECKTGLGLAVMQQAADWRTWAHWVSVAAPRARRGRARDLARRVLEWLGIGCLIVDGPLVTQYLPAQLQRRLSGRYLIDALNDGHKEMGIAGSQGCYWTPYKETCRELLAFVKKNPGCSMKQAIDGISHHYDKDTTARSCLLQWIHHGKVPGVRGVREGRRIQLYAKEQAVTA